MQKIMGQDVDTTKPDRPSTAGKTAGYFRYRDIINGKLPTRLAVYWFNMIQDEILSALTACGITPDYNDDTQLGACFDKKANLDAPVFTGDVDISSGRRYASYEMSAAQTFLQVDGATTINFNSKNYDYSPKGTDLVSVTGWEFTADKDLVLRISFSLESKPGENIYSVGDQFFITLQTHNGTDWNTYKTFPVYMVMTAGAYTHSLNGSCILKLDNTRKFRLQFNAYDKDFKTNLVGHSCFIDIEEI